MNEPTLTKTLLKSFAILIDGGYRTYGDWSAELLQTKARLYAMLLDDPKITRDVVQATTMRYMRREVWIWKGCEQQQASLDFPSAPEFRDACLQAYHAMYQTLAIGYSTNEKGYQIMHTVEVRRSIPQQEKDQLIQRAREQLGLPTPDSEDRQLTADELAHAKMLIERTLGGLE